MSDPRPAAPRYEPPRGAPPRNATLPNLGQPWQKRATSAPSRRATLGIAPHRGSSLRNAMLPVAMGGPEP
jgi:hypothetical protein